MKRFATATVIAAIMASSFAQSVSAQGITYLRKGSQEIQVFTNNGRLFCRRTSDGFEMCHGMTEQADGSWKGKGMRHPDMPKFMKFNGTVVFSETGLNIKGCALGICDDEDWTKK